MAEGKFVITAQNKIKEGLDSAKKDLLGFEDAAQKVGDTLNAALTVTAIAAGLKKLGEAAFDCYKEFGEMDRRMQQLRIALDGNESSFQKASSLIENMGRKSLASKDDIEGLVAELASLGKSDKDIEAITTAAVNLSNVTGKDLNAAFTIINATYAGTTGKLTQLLPELDGLSKKQLEAGEATRLINEKFGAMSDKLAENNIPQKLKNVQDGISDLKENIGQSAAGLFDPVITELDNFITKLNEALTAQRTATRQLLTRTKFEGLIMKGDVAGVREFMAGLSSSMTRSEGQSWIDNARKQNPLATSAQAAALRAAEIALLSFSEKLPKINPPRPAVNTSAGGTKERTPTQKAYDEATKLLEAVTKAWAQETAHPGLNGERSDIFGQYVKDALNLDAAPLGPQGQGVLTQIWQLLSKALTPAGVAGFVETSSYSPAADALSRGGQGQSLEEFYGALDESVWGPLYDKLDTISNPSEWTLNSQLSDAWKDVEGVIGGTTGEVRQVEGAINERSGNIEELLGDIWARVEVVVGDIIKHGGRTDGGRVDAGAGLSGETLAFDYQNPDGMRDAESRYQRLWARQEQAGEIQLSTAQKLSEAWGGFQEGFSGAFLGTSGGVDSGLSAEIIPPSYWQRLTEQLSAGFDTAFASVTAGMGSFASGLMGPISEMITALGPIAKMLLDMDPLLALLLPIIEGFVSVMGPAVTAVLQPVMDALTAIGQALGALLLPIMDALAPTFALLGQLIMVSLMPVIQLLAPFIQIVALMFQMLAPVLGLIAKAFIVLMSPIQFVADLFTWLSEVIKTFAWNIAHPFDQKDGPGAFESDAFSGLAERLAAIDQLTANGQTLQDGYNPSADTASQSANYRVQSVTINIYQQAPVVGSGGMDEFVTMIRDKFQALEYFGAAA